MLKMSLDCKIKDLIRDSKDPMPTKSILVYYTDKIVHICLSGLLETAEYSPKQRAQVRSEQNACQKLKICEEVLSRRPLNFLILPIFCNH